MNIALKNNLKNKFKNKLLNRLTLPLMLILPLTSGCSGLLAKQPLNTVYYSLDKAESKPLSGSISNDKSLPTLIVYPPKADAGYGTRKMMYSRQPHQLEYFARSEWIDTPSHMLQPLMVTAIEKTHTFNAVLSKPSNSVGDLRLESEVVKLVHDFNTKPSQVQFIFRVTMIDNSSNKVIAWREFDERVTATTDNPMGGVAAANQAVSITLQKLGEFTRDTAIDFYK